MGIRMATDQLYINADVGEGYPNDRAILPLINQVNIACGGHAGSESLMEQTIKQACEFGCALGAHPGYADPEHFGRRSLILTETVLENQLRRQLDSFEEAIEKTGVHWHHIKPHGALYHDIAQNQRVAEVFLEVISSYGINHLFLNKSCWAGKQAKKLGITVWEEAFLDRNYDESGQLLPRAHPKAMIENKEEAREQFMRLRDSSEAQTYCIHGDHYSSVEILKYLHSYFPQWGLNLSQT